MLFRRGGFVWYGGFLGATAGILLNGWRRRVPPRFTAEICAAPLALGYALGRVGCFLVNDDYGIPTSLPWGMKFPNGLPPTTVENLQAMHVHFPAMTDPNLVVPAIAQTLGLSEKTVTNHLTHIFQKTDSENRTAATTFAIRHGLA